jgi:uncharacterized protein YjbJ (UPF0337 family)
VIFGGATLSLRFGDKTAWMGRSPSIETRGGIMSSGTTDKVKGRLKEAAGALTDDDKLKNEGKADQAIGKVKDTAGKILDKAKELVKDR